MTWIFYKAILVLGIREWNEVTWQGTALPVQREQNTPRQKDMDPSWPSVWRTVRAWNVSVGVVWLLVLEEAGSASLCLQRPLEIILTATVRAALHSRTLSSAKRVCKRVASGTASYAVLWDNPLSACWSSLVIELLLDPDGTEASWDGIARNLYFMQKRLCVYSQAVAVYLPC